MAASDFDQQSEAVSAVANDARHAASSAADQAVGLADQLKQQASEHVSDAKDIVSNLASEARSKVSDIIDQQKNVGADKLSGLSKAAQSAAGELEEQSPQVAQLMRDAASTVDHFAGDLRSSNISDVIATVSSFARKQPVAFFAASVLAGFVLARFVKSEPVPVPEPERRPRKIARR